jgi:hypothetical protein
LPRWYCYAHFCPLLTATAMVKVSIKANTFFSSSEKIFQIDIFGTSSRSILRYRAGPVPVVILALML